MVHISHFLSGDLFIVGKITLICNMKFSICKESGIPLYKQVVASVKDGIKNGTIHDGDPMPSLNTLAADYDISMETAKKAYNVLKSERYLSGRQGKGFYVSIKDRQSPKKVVMILDKLSSYKLAIHKGLTDSLDSPAEVMINVYNQDISMFEKIVTEADGVYDYYIIAPHFPADVPLAKVLKILKKIPNDRLILIDRDIPELKGHIGRVYQDFANDAADALPNGFNNIRRYSNVVIVDTGGAMYSGLMIPQMKETLKRAGIRCIVSRSFKEGSMKPGTLYIVLSGQLDTEHFAILREASSKGYALGKAVGLVTYNDEPVNEFICGGLSCFSTDFHAMGQNVAEMINSGTMRDIHNPFSLVLRNSL